MRTACLRVPDLPLAAECRAHPEQGGRPLAIASGAGPRAEIVSVSPEALRRGVRRGASVAQARAVCADLCVRPASPALESAARAALLDAALSFSPRAALAPRASGAWASEAAVHLDASGIGSLFASERSFASALAARAERLGLPGDVAIASSRSTALLASRRSKGSPCIVAPGRESEFLAPLPIDILDPDDALAETLTRFGVHTVRDLLDLPRRSLGTRLGPRVLRLIALARGEETEAPLPVPDAAALQEAIDLEFPVDRLEPLCFVLKGLISRLLQRLEARHLACGDLRIELELEGRRRDARRIGLAAPTLDARALSRLVRQALETHPPQAPALRIGLETRGCPPPRDQLDLFRPAGPAPAVLGNTLSELESLCGSGRVGAPRVADDHRPDAFALDAFRNRRGEPKPLPEPGSPALRALRPPVPAQVRLVGGRPEAIRSAIANGRIVRISGPWRTTGAWWSEEQRFAYDSFDVQTSDGTVTRLRLDWIRRTWHIDGVYD